MELPAPNESDPEAVTTALETAAIFAAKGDVAEASRWLGRAADFANLAGNASRAETFSLSARALSATGGDASDDTESEIVARPLPTPPQKRVSVRPQAPSERPQDSNANNSQPMLLVRQPAATPAPPAVRSVSPAPPSVRASTSAPLSTRSSLPSAVSPQTSASPQAATAFASSPSRTPAPSAVNALAAKEQQLAAKEQQEVSAVRESSVRTAPPPKPVETPKPVSKSSLHHELHRPFRLQGARVSIAQSQGSSRYYVLKVLEDGEPVPQGEHEAFLVLTDPNAAR